MTDLWVFSLPSSALVPLKTMLFQEAEWALSCSEETKAAETCRRSALGSVLGVTIVPAQGYGASMRGGGGSQFCIGGLKKATFEKKIEDKVGFSPEMRAPYLLLMWVVMPCLKAHSGSRAP